jgi:sodium/potassium/calcium exchanger 6
VAISLALSPIWLWFYFSDQFDIDIFSFDIGSAVLITALGMGLVVMRYAPGGEGPMDLYMVVPVTLYGFAVAATWIDSIANKLVEILELFGILLRIPSTVLGLTVLAFGNSTQDLIANVTLSKKGLSTMATTACFAGPIFNLCVGLGLGFWALMKSTGRDEIHVELPRNIATGFMFAIANCILIIFAGVVVGKGVIGTGYGYGACGMYLMYVLTSLYV